VGQFVEKDDKYAMQQFVNESLTLQVKGMLALEQDSEDENLEPIMEQLRQKQEEAFASGARKRPKRKGTLRPRPATWDSDEHGEWEDAPGAFDEEDDEPAAGAGFDDDASIISTAPSGKKTQAKKPAAKKAPAKAKAPAKPKAPTKAKAPAKAPARGRKKVVGPELSDDEDEDDDVVMFDEAHPPVKSQPKRAAASKGRQTQLNFSQPSKTQMSMELSDDEISDEDAFEPMASSSKKR
jgi:double-strand break repair protein MRE11